MKIAIISFLLLVACAGNSQPPLTPTEKVEASKMTSDDYQESLAYEASLYRIQDKFLREKRAIESCLVSGTPKLCVKLRVDYCEVGVLLDTRGYHHYKPYC